MMRSVVHAAKPCKSPERINCGLSAFSAADDALEDVETAKTKGMKKLESKDRFCSAQSRCISRPQIQSPNLSKFKAQI